jgi:hypothetical protein
MSALPCISLRGLRADMFLLLVALAAGVPEARARQADAAQGALRQAAGSSTAARSSSGQPPAGAAAEPGAAPEGPAAGGTAGAGGTRQGPGCCCAQGGWGRVVEAPPRGSRQLVELRGACMLCSPGQCTLPGL